MPVTPQEVQILNHSTVSQFKCSVDTLTFTWELFAPEQSQQWNIPDPAIIDNGGEFTFFPNYAGNLGSTCVFYHFGFR
jgi:hypothetical protein